MPRKAKNVPRLNIELGSSGLKETGGYVYEDFLPEFIGSRKYKLLQEMLDNEPLVSGVSFAIRQLIKQVKWKVKPASDSAEDKKIAEFVESCRNDMEQSWEETLDEILSMIDMGFSVHEVIYKVRIGPREKSGKYKSRHKDGKIGWRKLPIRAQETILEWKFNERGDILGCVQRTEKNFDSVFIPSDRMLLFRTTSRKNNPEGKSIFRSSYVPYFYKKRIQNLEAIGIERELNGVPVAKIPGKFMMTNASVQEKTVYSDYKNLVKNVRADNQTGIVIPSDSDPKSPGNPLYDFKLLSTQGRRAIDTEIVIGRYNKEILIPVMADFLLLGHESVGSYALSSDKTHLFATAVAGFMCQIKDVFNKHAIPALLELNNIYPDNLPYLDHGDLETENVKELAGAIKDLKAGGFQITDPKLHEEIVRRLGFESIGEDQLEIVEEPVPEAPGDAPKPKRSKTK